jgi:hypothetical protein
VKKREERRRMGETQRPAEGDVLEAALLRAQTLARTGHERYYVVQAPADAYDLVPASRYKRLQQKEPILAIAMPDGEIRRL